MMKTHNYKVHVFKNGKLTQFHQKHLLFIHFFKLSKIVCKLKKIV